MQVPPKPIFYLPSNLREKGDDEAFGFVALMLLVLGPATHSPITKWLGP